ncbi:MAG: alpha-1,2-fucosyltransferase [Bacteroidetes bacterium]|nr:alpha-1,2-fucosyltransferase [Bacteroidota bacterium]
MILVRLMGGLGNQMFQYAFGRRMAFIHNTELVLDQSLLLDKSQPHELVTHRDFDLDIFNIQDYRWATEEEIFSFNGNPKASALKKGVRKIKNAIIPKQLIIQRFNEYNKQYLSIKNNTCFVGRWQSELYFKDAEQQIRKEFTITTLLNNEIKKTAENIKNTNSICLHIRRGDLITSSVYSSSIGALSMEYYTQAIHYIKQQIENPTFFIFSDDIEWCKQNIILPDPTFYMNNTTAGEKAEGHLHLMQQCKHFIISNSTYAWWGAWLSANKNKRVIYPENWYKDSKYNNPSMSPKSWVPL